MLPNWPRTRPIWWNDELPKRCSLVCLKPTVTLPFRATEVGPLLWWSTHPDARRQARTWGPRLIGVSSARAYAAPGSVPRCSAKETTMTALRLSLLALAALGCLLAEAPAAPPPGRPE